MSSHGPSAPAPLSEHVEAGDAVTEPDGHGLPPQRNAALDGVRGLAIIWVVVHNAADISMPAATGMSRAFQLFAHLGWIGVQLFFALSGFLITLGLLQSRAAPHYFRNFYAKRALRILPLYYAVLFVTLVVLPQLPFKHLLIQTQGQSALWLFTANWVRSVPDGFVHFWSLAVEEQFYLLWPLVMWKGPPGRLLLACIWIAGGALVLRGVLVGAGADWWTLYSNTACRMDALALGGAGACWLLLPGRRRVLQERRRLIMILALALFLVAIPLTHAYDRMRWQGEILGYTVLALCAAAFVTVVASDSGHAGGNSILAWRPLRSMGIYSYAIYVFHGLLNKLIGQPWLSARFGDTPPTSMVFFYSITLLLISYLLAYASYHLFEKHFLNLKKYLGPYASATNVRRS
jgi:peptidoglycan/LPS O-acetylase OafA/YrhL